MISKRVIEQAPAPLAELARRATNSKTGLAILQNTVHYLGEATAALSASYWLGRATAAGLDHDEAVENQLRQIMKKGPSFGLWVGLARDTAKAVGSTHIDSITEPLHDDGSLERLGRLLSEEAPAFGEAASQLASAYQDGLQRGPLGFLEFLVVVRNKLFAHGSAMVPENVARRIARPFLEATCFAIGTGVLWEASWLGRTGIDPLDRDGSKFWRRLHGLDQVLIHESMSVPSADEYSPKNLYLIGPQGPIRISPLVIHDEDETGLSRFGFYQKSKLARSQGGASSTPVKSVTYLDYLRGNFKDHTHSGALDDLRNELAERRRSLEQAGPGSVSIGPQEQPSLAPVPAGHEGKERFGDFVIVNEIGRGAMGIVYEAIQVSLGRHVALKVLPPVFADDPIALGRFRREVKALALCDHPNVVRILSSGIQEGRPWYAMEFIDGADLSVVFRHLTRWAGSKIDLSAGHLAAASSRGGQLNKVVQYGEDSVEATPEEVAPPPEIQSQGDIHRKLATLFADVAEGVGALHAQSILHRDIKPANIMLTGDGERLVVMDLGLAMGTEMSMSLSRASGSDFVGTARYAAPEQIQFRLVKNIDHRADQYSLAATMYEIVTLSPLYVADSIGALLSQKLNDDPKATCAVNPSVPRDLGIILDKALSRRVEDRYLSVQHMAADLRAFAAGEPISARPPTVREMLSVFYHRKKALVQVAAAAVLTLVVVVAIGFGMVLKQAEIAEAQRAIAEKKTRETLATLDTNRAYRAVNFATAAIKDKNYPLAARLLREATPAQKVPRWQELVRSLINRVMPDLSYSSEKGIESAWATRAGDRVAIAYADGALEVRALEEKHGALSLGPRQIIDPGGVAGDGTRASTIDMAWSRDAVWLARLTVRKAAEQETKADQEAKADQNTKRDEKSQAGEGTKSAAGGGVDKERETTAKKQIGKRSEARGKDQAGKKREAKDKDQAFQVVIYRAATGEAVARYALKGKPRGLFFWPRQEKEANPPLYVYVHDDGPSRGEVEGYIEWRCALGDDGRWCKSPTRLKKLRGSSFAERLSGGGHLFKRGGELWRSTAGGTEPFERVVSLPLGAWHSQTSPDGRWIAAKSANHIAILDADSLRVDRVLYTGYELPDQLVWSPDSHRVATYADTGRSYLDHQVLMWDLEKLRANETEHAIYAVSASQVVHPRGKPGEVCELPRWPLVVNEKSPVWLIDGKPGEWSQKRSVPAIKAAQKRGGHPGLLQGFKKNTEDVEGIEDLARRGMSVVIKGLKPQPGKARFSGTYQARSSFDVVQVHQTDPYVSARIRLRAEEPFDLWLGRRDDAWVPIEGWRGLTDKRLALGAAGPTMAEATAHAKAFTSPLVTKADCESRITAVNLRRIPVHLNPSARSPLAYHFSSLWWRQDDEIVARGRKGIYRWQIKDNRLSRTESSLSSAHGKPEEPHVARSGVYFVHNDHTLLATRPRPGMGSSARFATAIQTFSARKMPASTREYTTMLIDNTQHQLMGQCGTKLELTEQQTAILSQIDLLKKKDRDEAPETALLGKLKKEGTTAERMALKDATRVRVHCEYWTVPTNGGRLSRLDSLDVGRIRLGPFAELLDRYVRRSYRRDFIKMVKPSLYLADWKTELMATPDDYYPCDESGRCHWLLKFPSGQHAVIGKAVPEQRRYVAKAPNSWWAGVGRRQTRLIRAGRLEPDSLPSMVVESFVTGGQSQRFELPALPKTYKRYYPHISADAGFAAMAFGEHAPVRIWSLERPDQRVDLPTGQGEGRHSRYSLAWHPSTPTLASAHRRDAVIHLWSAQGQQRGRMQLRGAGDQVLRNLYWSPTGRYLSAVAWSGRTPRQLIVFEPEQGDAAIFRFPIKSPLGALDAVHQIAWHPQEQFIALRPDHSSYRTKDLTMIYELVPNSQTKLLMEHDTPVHWSEDGKRLLLCSDGACTDWRSTDTARLRWSDEEALFRLPVECLSVEERQARFEETPADSKRRHRACEKKRVKIVGPAAP